MVFFVCLIFLLNLVDYSVQIVPIWNITTSAINLLSSVSEKTYTIVDRDLYNVKAKLTKTIKKTDEGITHENYLSINNGEAFKVDFENIESYYFLIINMLFAQKENINYMMRPIKFIFLQLHLFQNMEIGI